MMWLKMMQSINQGHQLSCELQSILDTIVTAVLQGLSMG